MQKITKDWIGICLLCLSILLPDICTASTDKENLSSASQMGENVTLGTSTFCTDCNMAPSFLWKGKFATDKEKACQYFMKAIDLCPGFIRPYELMGNLLRKEGRAEDAIEFFTKAAELGTTNYKLYYLLARLLFDKGHIDEASRNVKRSLSIRGDYSRAQALHQKIEKTMDRDGPRIILYEPSTRRGMKMVETSENLTVRGIATDKSGVAWVKINQQETVIDEYGNFLKDIPIQLGSNTIVVEAADSLDNRAHISMEIEGEKYALPPFTRVESDTQRQALYEKSFAVVIGIDNYHIWPSLEFAVNDASSFAEELQRTGFDNVTVILDKEATQRRILTELFHELPKKIGRNDRLFFYFAGHGQTEELPDGGKRGFIIPVDGDIIDPGATAISMEQIRSLSSRILAKHILYAMDSCYSGLGLNRSGGVSPKTSDYLRKIASMRAVQIITAGGKGEQAQEKEGHGLFTAHFLEALKGKGDMNKDNVITGTELGAYLRPTVSNASGQAQTPLFGRLEGEGEFLFFVRQQ